MDLHKAVVDKLAELNINFELVEHEPVFTTEQANVFILVLKGCAPRSCS